MQLSKPHPYRKTFITSFAAAALTAAMLPVPVSAGEGGGEGQTLLPDPSIGNGFLAGIAMRPRFLNFGNIDDAYTGQQSGNSVEPANTPRPRRFLIPPDFYKQQIEMHEEQMKRLEAANMRDSESYKAAVMFHQRALQDYQRSLADAEEDGF